MKGALLFRRNLGGVKGIYQLSYTRADRYTEYEE